jgi:hypothetical protein
MMLGTQFSPVHIQYKEMKLLAIVNKMEVLRMNVIC